MQAFVNSEVAAKFASYPTDVRRKMLALRELVFRTAATMPEVDRIDETLKWGEPAYVTSGRSGSTVRMDWKVRTPTEYALYFNCNTTLVQTFRTLFPKELHFGGNRAIILEPGQPAPRDVLAFCLGMAFRYHLDSPIGRKARPRGLATRGS
jgi:hypothetical protein